MQPTRWVIVACLAMLAGSASCSEEATEPAPASKARKKGTKKTSKAKKPFVPGWIGVSHATVTKADAERLGLADTRGARVARVAAGGPADKAGLRVDDVIFAFHGAKIGSAEQFAKRVKRAGVGDQVRIAVKRAGKTVELTLVPSRRPK